MSGDANFGYLRELVRRESGIVLDESKNYLVEARLSPVARQAGLDSINALVEQLQQGAFGLRATVVEALTTNETSFFRDVHPFEALGGDVLPALIAERKAARRLRFWSAASAAGQEAYSIAMVLREKFPDVAIAWDVEIVGTDIADGVLAQAREGRYSQIEVNRGLPATMLTRYFERDGVAWKVKPELRRMVDFRAMNLIGPWRSSPVFDVIFLRNVLIYFDADMKRAILDKVRRVLAPDGYLFLGSSEIASDMQGRFVQERSGRTSWYRPA